MGECHNRRKTYASLKIKDVILEGQETKLTSSECQNVLLVRIWNWRAGFLQWYGWGWETVRNSLGTLTLLFPCYARMINVSNFSNFSRNLLMAFIDFLPVHVLKHSYCFFTVSFFMSSICLRSYCCRNRFVRNLCIRNLNYRFACFLIVLIYLI
jgi:hypothetical protein